MQKTTLIVLLVLASLSIFLIFTANKKKRIELNRANAWPEVLDLIIASLQSGASITESLAHLGKIGPSVIRSDFLLFAENVLAGDKFESALGKLKETFADPISDQLFEALYFAAKFGSKNTVKILRELSEYVSSDLALRAEINTRFGWVRNSANLAAFAPWILLLILRTQENARVAYEQSFGQLIMVVGVIATLTAYLWMNKIARLPNSKRLFTLAMVDN
jgi:tight adherence protein B